MLASVTSLPVIGVPVPLKYLDGMDSLLSIVQMPAGIPVATFAIGRAGAVNAALHAAALLATTDAAVAVHGYTRGEYAYDVNEALRRGPGHPGFDLAQANARAITDGLDPAPGTYAMMP